MLLLLINDGKIKTTMEVRQKAVAAILLLEAMNDEETKEKSSYKVRKWVGEGATGFIYCGEGTCHRRHTGLHANDEDDAQTV